MNIAYLKQKMQADRIIALKIENALVEINQDLKDTANTLYSGVERASWYGSCLFDDYKDVCKQLMSEDYRMLIAVKQVYLREDVILDMVEIFFKKKLRRISEEKQNNILQEVEKKSAEHASTKFSKLSLAYVLAKIVRMSKDFNDFHTKIINKSSLAVVQVGSFYGKIQRAVMAARRLKNIEPEYYWELYNEKIEMLYFLIEPEMSKIIYMTNSGSYNEEDVVYLLNQVLKK
ncbi:hypothetical protein [Pectobacterium colocasium]|uniref:hypothetical protein n=1 Tax=Pectobacterium colocasium TaxID=2878098 RepID=UPI003B28C251